MPPVDEGAYLVGYLQEMGFSNNSGMGLAPLSFLEISAWEQSTCLKLSPWEALTIRQLSVDYVVQLSASSSQSEPAPFWVEDIQKQRKNTNDFFEALAQRNQPKVKK